jgi:hypothetical protein
MTDKHRIPLLAIAALAIACSDDTTQPSLKPGPTDLTGAWSVGLGGTVPGVLFALSLRDSGQVVTGTGTWANEAGPNGTLVANGTAADDAVHLRIIYLPNALFVGLKPDTAQLDGVLTTHDRIDGTLRRGSLPPSTIQLVRTMPVEP